MGIGERLDAATVTYLKNVRLRGMAEREAWEPVQRLLTEAEGAEGHVEAIGILVKMLLDLNKAIWNRDAPVRKMQVDYLDDSQLAKIGLLACDARDFNEFRTRAVDLINLLCGDERARPVGMNENRFDTVPEKK